MGKSRIRHRAGPPPEADDFFHWHDESSLAALDVDGDSLRELLRPLAYGPPSPRISTKLRRKFQRIMGKKKGETIPVRVATLLEACKLLNRQPNLLEKTKLFRGRYPIPLAKPEIYKLMTHVINEGSVKGGRNPRGVYCNLDLSLHESVSKLIHSLGSHGNRRIGKDNVPETYVSAIIARLMIKAGLVPGKKTRGQYFHHLPKRILDDPDLSRYHMSATLTEEGSPSLRLTEGSKPYISIGYSRSIDVTDSLPSEYIHNMEQGIKYPIRPLPNEIIVGLILLPFPQLDDEIRILGDYDIKVHEYPSSLYKSKRDRVTTEWCVGINGVDAVTKFIDGIGFLPGSNVETRYNLIWSLYQKYKDKAVNHEDVDQIRKELGIT